VGDTGFLRFSVGRTDPVTFYLSQPRSAEPLPLIVWIQGTGCGSHFQSESGRVWSGLQSILAEVAGDRAIVLAVEKPGVEFLAEPPRDLRDCGEAFRRHFTLPQWSERINAAILASRKARRIDIRKVLIIGHSEGGLVSMAVSNRCRYVTHAASVAGGGPSYLFHLAEYFKSRGENIENSVYACWHKVLASPEAYDQFCWGQTHRQWSSFMRTSLIREALRSPARLYFAHGTADEQNSVLGFDVLRAELEAAARTASYDRVSQANHAMDLPGQSSPEGLRIVFARIVDWFLQ
jgi:pimeloyl-ACP methyl ester carboxylesterase